MAKVFGAAGEHAGRQSVAAFKRMFATVLIVAVVVAFFGGVLLATLLITQGRNPIGWIAGMAVVVSVLCRRDNLFVRGVMVFPKASVAALFGKTRSIHCVRIEKLRDYIDNPKFSQKLSPDRVNELSRALNGIAGMDEQFGSRHSGSD